MLTPEQTDKIIDGFFRLGNIVVGPLVGALIAWFISSWTKKRTAQRKLKRELEKHKLKIYATKVTNYLSRELLALKNFILDNPELLENKKENSDFFNEWLQDPFIEMGPAAGMWDKEKLDRLRKDIQKLTV